MTILLNADKISQYPDEVGAIFDYFEGVKNIDAFVKKVNELSVKYADPLDPTNDKIKSFKGDMFELFGEMFFNSFRNNPSIGLRDYEIIPRDEDYGVDAIGTNAIGNRVAIQYKFKSNPMDGVEYAAIARTYAAGRLRHNLSLEDKQTIWVVTTGSGTTGPCKEVFGDKLHVIDRDELSYWINKSEVLFWRDVHEQIQMTANAMG